MISEKYAEYDVSWYITPNNNFLSSKFAALYNFHFYGFIHKNNVIYGTLKN
jgi:hypothetical protein